MKHGTVQYADCFLLLNIKTEVEEFVVFVCIMGKIIAHQMTEQAIQCDHLWKYLWETHTIDERLLDVWDAPDVGCLWTQTCHYSTGDLLSSHLVRAIGYHNISQFESDTLNCTVLVFFDDF